MPEHANCIDVCAVYVEGLPIAACVYNLTPHHGLQPLDDIQAVVLLDLRVWETM